MAWWSRCIAGVLLAGLVPSLVQAGAEPWLPLSAPESPALWWALDTGPADSETSPQALIDRLSAWLRQDGPMLRPRPSGGLRIGLLARVPDAAGQQAVRILHPPHPLDAPWPGPAVTRHRALLLAAGLRVLEGAPAWPAGQSTLLQLALPVPSVSQSLRARLTLPLDHAPARWPQLLAGLTPDTLQPVAVTAPDAAHVSLDLSPLMPVAPALLEAPSGLLSVYLRVSPQDADELGAWRPWSRTAPAHWRLDWLEPAGPSTGRERLLQALDGLLWRPGASPVPTADDDLLAALAQAGQDPVRLPAEVHGTASVASPPDCGPGGGVLIRSADHDAQTGSGIISPLLAPIAETAPWRWQVGEAGRPWPAADARVGLQDLGDWLDRWRDRALAPGMRAERLVPRQHDGVPAGTDVHWLQPVPGRLSWPGDHAFEPCRVGESCPPDSGMPSTPEAGLRARLAGAASGWRWLTDAGLGAGMALADWRARVVDEVVHERFLGLLGRQSDAGSRAGLQAALDDWLRAPVPVRGIALPFTQVLASGGVRNRLLWIASDGPVWQFDEGTADPGWVWLPVRAESRWLRHRADPAVARPDSVTAADWQLWRGQGSGMATGGRTLYGLSAGGLVALDLDDPEQPKLRFTAASGIMPLIGSLTLLDWRDANGTSRPLLLLSAAASQSPPASQPALTDPDDVLQLVDGLSGELLWRAGAASAPGREPADPRLRAGWSAAWRPLSDAAGRWLYGVDDHGLVWRLRLDDGSAQPSALAPVAVLDAGSPVPVTDAGGLPLPRRFPDAPSVAWLRDAAGVRRPALAIADHGAVTGDESSGEAVHVLLDRFPAEPLAGAGLPVWSAEDGQAPLHASGWRWRLPGDARLASAPQWLMGRVVVTSAWPQPVTGACALPSWLLRLHQLPWRRNLADPGEVAVSDAASAVSAPAAVPSLNAAGRLVLPGLADMALPVPLPDSGRFRTGKRPLASGE